MDNLLKRQLAQIKKRAMWLRRKGEAREARDGGDAPPAPGDAEHTSRPTTPARDADSVKHDVSAGGGGDRDAKSDGGEIVEAVVKTGAVVRGGDFDKLRTLRRRWRRQDDDETDTRPARPVLTYESVTAGMKTGAPRPIESVAPGEARTIDGRPFYLIRAAGPDVDRDAVVEARQFARLHDWPEDVTVSVAGVRRPRRKNEDQTQLNFPLDTGRMLFLDIETAGLSANTYLFLCGVMYLRDGEFVVEQVFARDYEEEAGLLAYVRELMVKHGLVVTYNGATFDLPFIRTRMAVHRIPDVGRLGSVDLLHTTRRVFREILPNRRLVTVERHLRRVDRTDDIPSRFIPEAYHDFVHTGDARVMKHVLYHNRMDLFTMAVILNRLADPTSLDD